MNTVNAKMAAGTLTVVEGEDVRVTLCGPYYAW
eukprot:CAMPEP_0183818824 /NCGR_PEP_ID=MMETSP0803_2-20130417/62955_1 /TAXON_ID=195967 /ORGANISM="Crustomastix stigmata, Strain CCMP3273" /LENGTH=32 /DNA_ID= /DNA_START= /DNA_END= /DNA_ORIENTATION=